MKRLGVTVFKLAKAVRLSKRFFEMENYTQDPLNPHPVFPQWSPWNVYPYQYWGTMRKYIVKQKYYMPTLENDFLRVTIAPDIGGRVWDIYDKIGRRHLANFNTGVRTYNAGFGLNYTTGGIECNYPLAHSPTTSRQREVSTERYEDGSAAIIISELDQIWRTRWSVAYRLYPDRSFLELCVRIYNRTPHDSRHMYWNNCGFVLNKSSQFIFPEEAGAEHGKATTTFSWPMWRRRNLSYWREVPPEMLGLYMLNSKEPYFGYYDHNRQFGLVHYADLADVPGKKYWTWGTDPVLIESYRKTHHTQGEVYGEIQSGRIVIQEHLDRVPPETECQWTEVWYPVRDTGAFTGVGPGAAMRVEVVDTSSQNSRIKVRAIANGFFPDARVTVNSDGSMPVERAIPLDPKNAIERILTVKGKVGPAWHTTVILRNKDNEVLSVCRLRHPNKRDSWREIVEIKENNEPVGVEEFFRMAEDKAKDWGNHELKPLYEKVLQQDNGFSPARCELGKFAIWQGNFNEAIEHFSIAGERDPDSLEVRYFHGVALMYAGRLTEARKMFELSNRYDWEACSLVRLSELYMREKDWHHALKYLDRLASAYPRLSRPRCLRAICLRKLNRKEEAVQEITEALQIDGQDPFLQMEMMFIKSGSTSIGRLSSRAVKLLIEQVRAYEPPLLEAGFDYLSVHMYEEAKTVLRVIPHAGPLATFVLGYVTEKLGRRVEAMKLLHRACTLNVVGHQPWRLEMIPVLNWTHKQLPKEPRPLFLLGSLLMARRRTEDGLRLWQQAEKMGERHYLLSSNFGFYESQVAKDVKKAIGYFQRAVRAKPDDLYVKHGLFRALCTIGKHSEAVRFLEKEKKAVLRSPRLAYDLLDAYLERDNYRKFDALCEKVNFTENWQILGPHRLWLKRHMNQALQLMRTGDLEQALSILRKIGKAPAHLGMDSSNEDVRRFYHIGCIYEKMGKIKDARRYWEKAVIIPHYTGYESAYWNMVWRRRYFQALSLQKLGRNTEANVFLDAMELLAKSSEIPLAAREGIMDLVERGRFASDENKDPSGRGPVEVQTKAEA